MTIRVGEEAEVGVNVVVFMRKGGMNRRPVLCCHDLLGDTTNTEILTFASGCPLPFHNPSVAPTQL